MSNQPKRRFAVLVQPFDGYDTEYYFTREQHREGRPVEKYFYDQPEAETRCTFEEARELINEFRRRYPGRECKTVMI